jgi:DNA-binding CsgD family transcriptional regulator
MQRMTQGGNAPDDGRLAVSLAEDGDAPRPALLGGLALLLGTVTALVGVDVADDAHSGGSHGHIAIELLIMAAALAGAITLVVYLFQLRRRTHVLQGRLRQAETEAERFREESRSHLQGLAVAIDGQLARWSFSEAEREVALLLLKGLSHKEIATIRGTSERTVRGQALGLYRKAGLSGRAELAAFFLEDLLVPTPPGPGAAGGSTAR